jgi:hypothetical protein
MVSLEQLMDEEGTNKALEVYIYYLHLPLASQTQFVEAGVKEAENVSNTDRLEELRSAYAIIRLARVHCVQQDLMCLKYTERIEALFFSVLDHNENQEDIKRLYPDYDERLQEIAATMRKDHFKQERAIGEATAGCYGQAQHEQEGKRSTEQDWC